MGLAEEKVASASAMKGVVQHIAKTYSMPGVADCNVGRDNGCSSARRVRKPRLAAQQT
jgi:hypothetical protein